MKDLTKVGLTGLLMVEMVDTTDGRTP